MIISKEIAKKIIQMESVCFSEGSGPDISELLLFIGSEYPEIKDAYSYLNWPTQEEVKSSLEKTGVISQF